MMGGFSGMGSFMGIGMLLFWGLVILGVFLLFRGAAGQGRTKGDKPGAQTPLDVLKGRLARGEITQEEFERMKKDLE